MADISWITPKPKKSVTSFPYVYIKVLSKHNFLVDFFLKMANYKFVFSILTLVVWSTEALRFGPDPVTVETGILVIIKRQIKIYDYLKTISSQPQVLCILTTFWVLVHLKAFS